MAKAIQKVTESCKACAQVNPGRTMIGQGVRPREHRPGIHWEIDFTEIKPGMYGYKYLLVFVDTFSGWVEAFPTKHETAKMVTMKLLEEIFPRYGMPQALWLDNGPAFVSQGSINVQMGPNLADNFINLPQNMKCDIPGINVFILASLQREFIE
ncbi:protein NYNRIN-like [Rattus norvegicus]|uniref:protein NYNRIN-like n=1 Tax=Rattus norvegicus TaxID=10116 RepID=UPI002FD7CA38